jgi:hypothetical protein
MLSGPTWLRQAWPLQHPRRCRRVEPLRHRADVLGFERELFVETNLLQEMP